MGEGVLRRSSVEDCRGRASAEDSSSSRMSSSSGCKVKHGSVDVILYTLDSVCRWMIILRYNAIR